MAADKLQLPAAIAVAGIAALFTETGEFIDAVLARRTFKIGLYFRPGRQVTSPVRIALEAVGIEVRGDVTGQTRVRILAPGAADPVGLFIQGDVLVAQVLQANASEYAGHAGAENDNARLLLRHETVSVNEV